MISAFLDGLGIGDCDQYLVSKKVMSPFPMFDKN